MQSDKFLMFVDCFNKAFIEVTREMAELEFTKCDEAHITEERRFAVIIGTVGRYRGRIVFQAGADVVRSITGGMNGEPLGSMMDTYFYLAEYANTFCGNAVTHINNACKDSELRLTPPAILSGTGMKIATPSIKSGQVFFSCRTGHAVLDIGFEGV